MKINDDKFHDLIVDDIAACFCLAVSPIPGMNKEQQNTITSSMFGKLSEDLGIDPNEVYEKVIEKYGIEGE